MYNVRVEYESTPIRHIAVECPKCNKWFMGWDIFNGSPFEDLRYDHDIDFATFTCPVCGEEFGGLQNSDRPNIEISCHPEVYEGCLKRKETWE